MILSKYGQNRPSPRKGESNTLPTEVLPNQSYTLRELIARYRCGQRLPVAVGSEAYDDVELCEVPVERSPDFSMEDASMYREAVERRIRLRKEMVEQNQYHSSAEQEVTGKDTGSNGDNSVSTADSSQG